MEIMILTTRWHPKYVEPRDTTGLPIGCDNAFRCTAKAAGEKALCMHLAEPLFSACAINRRGQVVSQASLGSKEQAGRKIELQRSAGLKPWRRQLRKKSVSQLLCRFRRLLTKNDNILIVCIDSKTLMRGHHLS